MGQFTNEIAAGNLPGFQEKISSIAAGQTAKTVADSSLNNAKAAAAGGDDRVAAAGGDDRVAAVGGDDRVAAAGKDDRVAAKSRKTFNDAAAGQGCVGLDERQDSIEAAAGQRCKVAPVGYRQHDGERMAEEAAAGEGIPDSFGELGVGEGEKAKEAAAAGGGQHGRYANEAAGRFENEANFAEWMGITAAELPSSRPIGAEQSIAEKTAAAGLFGAANTAAELPGTPKTAEKMPSQVDAERGQRVESDGGSSFEQENTTTNDKTTTNKMKSVTDSTRGDDDLRNSQSEHGSKSNNQIETSCMSFMQSLVPQ
ncbi:hypothetical protein FRX31_018797, partial [Thalictrum thalictroides]